jgi:hypothetical protein
MALRDDDRVAWVLRPGFFQVNAQSLLALLRESGRSVLVLAHGGQHEMRLREADADDLVELADRVNRDLSKFGVRCDVDNTSDGLAYRFVGVRLP